MRRYVTERILSQGITLVVKARDLNTGQSVVLKSCSVQDLAACRLLRQEASVLQLLRGNGTPRLSDAGIEDGRFFIVQEFVEGIPLHKVAKWQRQKGIAHAWSVMERMHEAGWLYLDAKPDHILKTNEGWKLIDFNSAVQMGQGQCYFATKKLICPECLTGKPPREAWDSYALGALLGELSHFSLTGWLIRKCMPSFSHLPLLRKGFLTVSGALLSVFAAGLFCVCQLLWNPCVQYERLKAGVFASDPASQSALALRTWFETRSMDVCDWENTGLARLLAQEALDAHSADLAGYILHQADFQSLKELQIPLAAAAGMADAVHEQAVSAYMEADGSFSVLMDALFLKPLVLREELFLRLCLMVKSEEQAVQLLEYCLLVFEAEGIRYSLPASWKRQFRPGGSFQTLYALWEVNE